MKYRQHIAKVFVAAVAVVTFVSCSDSYPGLEYTGNDISLSTNESMDKTPVMVFINEQNFFSVSATRSGEGEEGRKSGTGPFTDLTNPKYKNSLFYVFAFRGQEFTQGYLAGHPIDLSKSRFSDRGSEDNVTDCLVDGKEYEYGALAQLTEDYPGAFRLGEELEEKDGYVKGKLLSKEYYYGYSDQRLGYNFFAFHIDNLKENGMSAPHRNQDQIYYDITIDGTQDVMCGFAPRLTRGELDTRKGLKLNEEEKSTILNESDGLYSTFSAHRNINPVIDLTHQLTRLDFSLYPGDDRADDIVIEEISVRAQTHGKLVVATRDPHNGSADAEIAVGYYPFGEKVDVILRDKPENGGLCPEMDWSKYPISWNPKFKENIYHDDNEVKVGSSIMVPEADKYDITLKFHQKARDADGKVIEGQYIGGDAPLTVTYENISPKSSGFLRGYNYKISIAVYGLQPIKVDAFIHKWDDGGDVPVGDEDDEIRQ